MGKLLKKTIQMQIDFKDLRKKYEDTQNLSIQESIDWCLKKITTKANLKIFLDKGNEKLKEIQDKEKECVVCLVGERSNLCSPCGHLLFCKNPECCKVEVCPVCRARVDCVIQVKH